MRIKLLVCLLALLCLPFALFGCGEQKSDVRLGNIVIFGDSYSTFEGHIPDGYTSWYSADADYTDVNSVEETWWSILARRCDSEILLNCSFSGTTVCHTGYGGDCSETSFITRFDRLAEQGFFENNRVDTLIILGGLNDLWSGAPIGTVKHQELSEEDLYSFLPSVSYLLQGARRELPEARLIFVIEEDLSGEMKDGIRQICNELEVLFVETSGVSKKNSHPDEKGMRKIADQIISELENNR